MYKKNKLQNLFLSGHSVFRAQDLGILWDISNKNTLYVTIHRYVKRGVLMPIYQGLYSIKPIHQLEDWELGVRANGGFSYVSCETILAQNGLINGVISSTTLVSHSSGPFSIGSRHYRSRQLQDRYLFNSAGIVFVGPVPQATLERAVADILYFNPTAHFDAALDWKQVKQMQIAIGYPETHRS